MKPEEVLKLIPVPDYDRPYATINRIIDLSREPYDHETFLTFRDDEHNIGFQQWLETEGMEVFYKWYAQEYGT